MRELGHVVSTTDRGSNGQRIEHWLVSIENVVGMSIAKCKHRNRKYSLVLVLNVLELVSKLGHLSSWPHTQGLFNK